MAEPEIQGGDRLKRLFKTGWRNVRAASPRQLAGTVLLLILALLVARFSWQIAVTADAEKSLYDLRSFASAQVTEQDDRVQIVAFTDDTLIAARKRSPLDRGLLSRALQTLDGMGAKAIGIDILFDQPQDEDEELIATLRGMQTPVFVAYADIEGNEQDIVYAQQEFLDTFVSRLEGSNAKPASIRLNYADGVARKWPTQLAHLPPLLGRAMVAAAPSEGSELLEDYQGAIRFRLAPELAPEGEEPDLLQEPVHSAIDIDTFADPAVSEIPELAEALKSQIAGKYVLVGGEIVDIDRVETPFTTTTGIAIAGVRVHASMISQMLDGARLHGLASWQLWTIAALVVLAAALTSLIEARIWRVLPFLVAQLLVIGGLPFLLQGQGYDTLGMPAVGWAIGWILAFIAVSSAVRASGAVERRFAQGALGKYLPEDIAQEIIDNPEKLGLSGSKRQLYIVFTDLEGFTKMSHALEPEMVAVLLNDYLDRLSSVVLEYGGIIDKYVGDAVVAFWGAPIARPNDAEMAAKAGYAMWQAGEDFRKSVDPSLPPIGKTRVGMHYGEAVVGNFGGERRIQYTALGDAMNTAARLEAANKALGSSVMASREFAEASGLDWWRPMGKVVLRGRAQPVELFEPSPDFPVEDRKSLDEAMALVGKDTDRALVIVEAIAARHSSDLAVQNLLARIQNLGEDNAYVLG